MEVLPAIIEDSYQEVEEKLKLVVPLVDWVQVDIADGEFVGRRTWTHIEDLESAPPSLKIDLHIMVGKPRTYVARAMRVQSIRRITFHIEAASDPGRVAEDIIRSGRETGIALNPETLIERGEPFFKIIDALLIMGVRPGWGGQGFIEATPSRIAAAKARAGAHALKVGVDGGVHLETGSAKACVDAGADYLVVGTDIFGSQDPEGVIQRLQQLYPHPLKT